MVSHWLRNSLRSHSLTKESSFSISEYLYFLFDFPLKNLTCKFKGLISPLITVVSEVDTSCALDKVVKVYTFIKLLLSGPR